MDGEGIRGQDIISLAEEISDKTRHLTSVARSYCLYVGMGAVSLDVVASVREVIEQISGLESLLDLIEERKKRFSLESKRREIK